MLIIDNSSTSSHLELPENHSQLLWSRLKINWKKNGKLQDVDRARCVRICNDNLLVGQIMGWFSACSRLLGSGISKREIKHFWKCFSGCI